MKVLLINPPNNLFDVFELAPPIGLLSLASALGKEDVEIELLDCNLKGIADQAFVQQDFYEKTLRLVEEKCPDVVGLTSMVVNSHVVLELAKRIKAPSADADPRFRPGGAGTRFLSSGYLIVMNQCSKGLLVIPSLNRAARILLRSVSANCLVKLPSTQASRLGKSRYCFT